MNRVFVPMDPQNVVKILSGDKTTTLRGYRGSQQIGLFIGETAVTSFDGKDFLITNKGELTIDEVGGKDSIIKTESFGEGGPKYKQTIDWLNGSGRLYVYEIKNVN